MNNKTMPSAEPGVAQAKGVYDRIGAASAETTESMKRSAATTVKGAQEFNAKFMEYAQANTAAAFDFFQKALQMKSPSDFVALSTEHARKHLETLTEQTKELAELAQRTTLASAAPFKAGLEKTVGRK